MHLRLPFESGMVRVTSPFGERELFGATEFHKGMDLVGTDGTVVSISGGVVVRSRMVTDKTNRTWEWGNYIAIAGDDGYTVYYCHLAQRFVSVGQRVETGDVLGIQGNTGYSFGVHLHLEIRSSSGISVNPESWIGLPNETGAMADVERPPDYPTLVCSRCGLEEQTKRYLNEYKYASDLWRKLWMAMNGKESV